MAKTLISEMYCTKCGKRCMSIPRKKGGERESGHLKKVYCIFCKTEWIAAECDQNGHYTYRDFKRNAFYLRALYDNLKHKLFYKWYVYANIHLTLKQKNIAWSFLNHDVGYAELDNYD